MSQPVFRTQGKYYLTNLDGTQELAIPAQLQYLSLVKGVDETPPKDSDLKFEQLPPLVNRLDLSLPAAILVPNGSNQIFKKTLLKLGGTCGKFVLFTNLPFELCNYIFRIAAHEYGTCSRRVQIIEMQNGAGVHTFELVGEPRLKLFQASKQAQTALVNIGDYQARFAMLGERKKVYYSAVMDWVRLDFELPPGVAPHLRLLDQLATKLDIHAIKTLQLELNTLQCFADWAVDNMSKIKCLQVLHLTTTMEIPGRTDPDRRVLVFTDVEGDKYNLVPCYDKPDGTKISGYYGVEAFLFDVDSAADYQRIMDIWDFLDVLLQRVLNYPLRTELIIDMIPPAAASAR